MTSMRRAVSFRCEDSGMTTIDREQVRCHVCGHESEFPVVTHAAEEGAPDLDTRPPEPLRSTMAHWVQECPSCGYCASSIAHGPAKAARIVNTAAYKALRTNEAFPLLARRFQCASAILEHGGPVIEAGWQSVYAAWACDDADRDDAAVQCRERAVDLFERGRAAGFDITEQGGDPDAVLIDLVRRGGRFDGAVERCEKALAAGARPSGVVTVIAYEEVLARKGDAAAHTTAEAQAWRARPD